ncbi:hypothetical protein JCM8097_000064 [Rhodosporidiobolus ruineniae]
MTPTPSGPCCVCGKQTTQRCGACAESGFDLFFCSREHQKLVWFVHKHVCGSKSKPFQFPPLSKEELERANTNLHTVFHINNRMHQSTLDLDIRRLCASFNPRFLAAASSTVSRMFTGPGL